MNEPTSQPRVKPGDKLIASAELSWDAQSGEAPRRPTLESNLPQVTVLARPRRTLAIVIAALAGLALWLTAFALAWARIEEIRKVLAEALPEDVIADYGIDEIERVATLLIIVVAGFGLLLNLILVLATRTFRSHRSGAARIVVVIFAALLVPVGISWTLVSDPHALEMSVLIAQLSAVVIAGVLALTPAVTHWLRQYIPKESVSLTDLRAE